MTSPYLAVSASASGGAFSAGDQALLAAFADQAAIAIDNARLFEAANQRVLELEAVEESEWVESLDYVIKHGGPERVRQLLLALQRRAIAFEASTRSMRRPSLRRNMFIR